jgi:hypothetical protein
LNTLQQQQKKRLFIDIRKQNDVREEFTTEDKYDDKLANKIIDAAIKELGKMF